jgi:hypothetical protein
MHSNNIPSHRYFNISIEGVCVKCTHPDCDGKSFPEKRIPLPDDILNTLYPNGDESANNTVNPNDPQVRQKLDAFLKVLYHQIFCCRNNLEKND